MAGQPTNSEEDPRAAGAAPASPSTASLTQTTSVAEAVATDSGRLVAEAEQLLRRSNRRHEQVFVLGGGPGGCAAALRAAELGGRTVIVEERRLGGTPLQWGGVAVHVFLEAARRRADAQAALPGGQRLPLPEGMSSLPHQVEEVCTRLSAEARRKLEDCGVEVVEGRGTLTAHSMAVDRAGQRDFGSGGVVLACGASALMPDWAPEGHPRVLTPEGLLSSGTVPERLVVVGGGAVGVELGSLYSRLGAAVTLVEARPRLLPALDEDLPAELSALLAARGIEIRTSCRVCAVEGSAQEAVVRCAADEKAQSADRVLLAVGRRPNTRGLGLEARGVKIDRGRIVVDAHCQTSVGGVYALGDLVHGSGFAQVAVAEGRTAAGHALGENVSMRGRHVPVCVHSCPPVAAVGLSEAAAREAGHEVALGTARFEESVRGSLAEVPGGLVKVVANAQHGRLLGVHIVGPCAEELVGEAALALSFGATAAELARNLHPTPGYGEVLAEAAGSVRVAGGRG